MSIFVELVTLQPHIAGQGCLIVKNWTGGHERLEFSIQRNQDGYFLQGDQHWSNSQYWFKVAHFSVAANGDELETVVGPQLVDPLLDVGGMATFRIVLREQGGEGHTQVGMLSPAPNLQSSVAASDEKQVAHEDTGQLKTPVSPPAVVAPEPEPEPEPEPVPEPVVEPVAPEPVPVPPPAPAAAKKKGWLIALIIALLVLAAIAVGAWFWLNKTPAVDAPAGDTTQMPEPKPEPPADNQACTLDSMTTLPELAFVQACIKKAPGSAELLEIIKVAKANNHCGVAQRLYANRAQAGDLQIAAAYAHEYDPKFHQASTCFAEPDKATAAYWYETILSQEPENAEAKARFEELKP